MFGFDPFDMDFDGDVDGIDFLGFDYLIRCALDRDDGDDEENSGTWDDEIVRNP